MVEQSSALTITLPSDREIVMTRVFDAPRELVFDTLTLEDLGGKTKLTAHSLFGSVEDRDGMLQSGMEEGAAETWDRLAEHLRSMA